MKINTHQYSAGETHRVFRELNTEICYPFFCPQCDENFYGVETRLEEVDDTEMYQVTSSNGNLYLDEQGNVLRQETTSDCSPVVWFDLKEYRDFWKVETIPPVLDILDLRGILADGRELIWNRYRNNLTNGNNPL